MLDRLYLAVAVAAFSGCSFEGGFGAGYRCSVDEPCPSGTRCVGGFCAEGAPDGAVTPDAAISPDDAPLTARCGTMSLLRDRFDDAVAGPYFSGWSDPGVTVVQTGGHVAIQLIAGTSDAAYGGYSSMFSYDLTGGQLEATVSQVGGDYTTLELQDPEGRRLQMLVADRTTLIAKVLDIPEPDPRTAIPYDPVAHRHWRMREAGGTVFWETSPDRIDWSLLDSAPVPFPLDHARGVFAAGGLVAGVATEARFEDVGPEPAIDQAYCPIATLVDDFEATPLAPGWDGWSDATCTVTETGGQVALSYTGVGESWCGVDSRHLFDLGDSAMYVDAADAPAAARFVSFFQAVAAGDGETRLEITRDSGTLSLVQRVAGVEVNSASLPYEPVAHRYWRIAEDAGTVRWQTSPDATSWVTRHQASIGFDPGEVRIVIGAGHYETGPGSPIAIGYRSLNVP